MEKTFGLKTGMKVMAWIVGIIGLPFFLVGVPMIVLAVRGGITLRDDKVISTWVFRREHAWSDIAKIWWGRRAGGVVGAIMGRPLMLETKDGKKHGGIMVEAYRGTDEVLAELKKRAGLEPTAAP